MHGLVPNRAMNPLKLSPALGAVRTSRMAFEPQNVAAVWGGDYYIMRYGSLSAG